MSDAGRDILEQSNNVEQEPIILPPSSRRKEKVRQTLVRIPLHFVILLVLAIWLVPSVGLLVSSFRTAPDINASGWWTALVPPYRFTFQNYIHVLTQANISTAFLNSLTIAIPATIMPILIAAFAGYTLAWLNFPGRTVVFLIVVALLVVPIQMTLIPILRAYNKVHLSGTFPGVWLAHTAYGMPFAVYLLRNYIGELPGSLLEVARIDGADNFTIFYRLILPLSIPAIASLSIFQFMWAWNDLLVALVYLGGSPNVAPLTVAISNLVTSRGRGWEYLTAAAFISVMLPFIVFFSMQRYFIRGILAGSVKG